ncbi:tRNA uridine-5-carboxymethylaminomethyl(34) synthesis enzyme MnmG [soil metagenome]
MKNALLGYAQQSYDVIVIGAGHAGCEAALAAARIGASVLVLTPNLDRIGFMPCNPSIGGPAKGHIVSEVDALGGEMARAIDRTALQIRLLNASKGPAVQALRAQADKALYSMAMKEALEIQPGVELRQEAARIVEVDTRGSIRRVCAVTTDFGNRYSCGAAVITAGTFLRGSMIAGEWKSDGGRAGDSSSEGLAMSIGDVGIRLRRLKTGTPPRVDARSIDFSLSEIQEGSDTPLWFSLDGRNHRLERLELPPLELYPNRTETWRTQMSCYLVHTNEKAHQLIADNVDRSPMYNGNIHGTGTRYCPSIEDKVMRFPQKTSHGLFLEPEGWRTTEVYVQGANTSLPPDVQLGVLRSIPALRDARITRHGYAVEYDAIEPTELTPWFASKRVEGLLLAGQGNGTSGYEEAAGQGLVAGANAARYVGRQEPIVLRRDQAYTGVLADDLSSQEFIEPYRMLTSRAEHRLILRADNADDRLSALAYETGLINRTRLDAVALQRKAVNSIITALKSVYVSPNSNTNAMLAHNELPETNRSLTAVDYLRRPDVSLAKLLPVMRETYPEQFGDIFADERITVCAEIEVKYAAYVEKEVQHIERIRQMENALIPASFDYDSFDGLRNEAREKLHQVRPSTVGQASRIPGVTPGDIAVIVVHLKRSGNSSHPARRSADFEEPAVTSGD